MRVFRSLFLVLHLSLVVILADGKSKSSTGGQKLTFAQLSTMDLESVGFDGDILFDMEWPGAEAKEQAIQVQHLCYLMCVNILRILALWHFLYDSAR